MEDLDEIPQASPTTRNVEKEVTDADDDPELIDLQNKLKRNEVFKLTIKDEEVEKERLTFNMAEEQQKELKQFNVLQFQVMAPAYYNKNGQLVMGTSHGLGTPVYLVLPAPVLVSSSDNRQVLEVLSPAYFDMHQKKWVTGDPRDTFMGSPASSEPPAPALDSESGNQALALDSEFSNHKVQYQVLAPAYYDKHNQLVMDDRRGKDAPVYLVPPAPVLIRAAYNNKDQAEFMSQYIEDMLLKPAYYHQKRLMIGDPRRTEAPACLVPPALSLVHGFCNQQEHATVRMKAMTNNQFSQNKSSQQVCQEAVDIEGTERKAECPRQSSPVLD